MSKQSFNIPLTVPAHQRDVYLQHYQAITHNTGRLFLFAGDQKIEHLNSDFYGANIAPDAADPEHLFKIASKGRIGAFATQLGLIAQYGNKYPNINYVIKLNSKTNIVKAAQHDPLSTFMVTPQEAIAFKEQSGLPIVGFGYTVYLGSEYEHRMLREASEMILQAHAHGLLAILWMYPRGKAVQRETDAQLIAGAAGVGACLGADFVKINPSTDLQGHPQTSLLKHAVNAAGYTKVICSGGARTNERQFLETVHAQLHEGMVAGTATGRNIHQHDLDSAIRLCNAVAALVFDNANVEQATTLLSE